MTAETLAAETCSEATQRESWDALGKAISSAIGKLSKENLPIIVVELFSVNLIRGSGLFARGVIQAQRAAARDTGLYVELLGVVNTRFPEIVDIVIHRLVDQFLAANRSRDSQRDRASFVALGLFLAGLSSQGLLGDVLPLQVAELLMATPSLSSLDCLKQFLLSCGSRLEESCPRGVHHIFDQLRSLMQEGDLPPRGLAVLKDLFDARRRGFKSPPPLSDLIDAAEILPHEVALDDALDPRYHLDVFSFDPKYLEHEQQYAKFKTAILGNESDSSDSSDSDSSTSDSDSSSSDSDSSSSDSDSSSSDSDSSSSSSTSDSSDDSSSSDDENLMFGASTSSATVTIENKTTDPALVTLRRNIYLTVMSSMGYEECAHKLCQLPIAGHEGEVATMIVDCCAQDRTYTVFYGLLAAKFCQKAASYRALFEESFARTYQGIDGQDSAKIRNVANLFAHLLKTNALSWDVLSCVVLSVDATTASSRIFVKILFQEISGFVGIPALSHRLFDPAFVAKCPGLHTDFAMAFWKSIGLGQIIPSTE